MKYLVTVLLMMMSLSSLAQKISISKDEVYIDDRRCLTIDKEDNYSYTLYDKDKSEICFSRTVQSTLFAGSYTVVAFTSEGKKISTTDIYYKPSRLIEKLLMTGVIEGCVFQPEMVDKFILKYDDAIEKRPIYSVDVNTSD